MDTTPSAAKIPDCPDWCTQPAGHDYDSLSRDGALIRHHERELTDAVSVICTELNVEDSITLTRMQLVTW